MRYIVALSLLCSLPGIGYSQGESQTVSSRIKTPPRYERIAAPNGSFGHWLRNLPLRPGRPDIRLFNGGRSRHQDYHVAVLDINIGTRDLQQCADVIIRLRADYLKTSKRGNEIRFNFTSGDRASWRDWKNGIRPEVNGNNVTWRKSTEPDSSEVNFRRYLKTVYMYAGTMSLSRELSTVTDPSHPEIGDVYIRGGSPGHAMLVIDVAENESGERIFLLAQGWMPACDIHILRSNETISPWFAARSAGVFKVPGSQYLSIRNSNPDTPASEKQWPFSYTDLKRFRQTSQTSLNQTSLD